MAADSDIIVIEILGTRLQLRGGDNPEAVRRAGEYVRKRVHEMADRAPSIPSLQLALLVAMNIADELLRLTHRDTRAVEAALDKANRILAKTDVDFSEFSD